MGAIFQKRRPQATDSIIEACKNCKKVVTLKDYHLQNANVANFANIVFSPLSRYSLQSQMIFCAQNNFKDIKVEKLWLRVMKRSKPKMCYIFNTVCCCNRSIGWCYLGVCNFETMLYHNCKKQGPFKKIPELPIHFRCQDHSLQFNSTNSLFFVSINSWSGTKSLIIIANIFCAMTQMKQWKMRY